MVLPVWQGRQSLALPSVNPNAAISTAVNAFDTISDTLASREANEQEAAYRRGLLNQRLAEFQFEAGAEDRERQRIIDMNAALNTAYDQNTADQIANFEMSDANVAELMQQTGLDEQTIRTQGTELLRQSPELILDPTALRSSTVNNLASQGFAGEQVDSLLDNRMSPDYQRLNKDTQKMLIDALPEPSKLSDFVGKSGSGRGSSGSSPKERSTSNARADLELINETADRYRDGSRAWWSFNIGDEEIYEDDFKAGVTAVRTAHGVGVPFVIAAIDSLSEDDALPFKLGNDMAPENIERIGAIAKQLEADAYTASGQSTAGAARQLGLPEAQAQVAQSRADYDQAVGNIIRAGSYRAATSQDRLRFLQEQFGVTPKQAEKIDTKVKSTTNTQPSESQNVSDLLDAGLTGKTNNAEAVAIENAVEEVTGKKPTNSTPQISDNEIADVAEERLSALDNIINKPRQLFSVDEANDPRRLESVAERSNAQEDSRRIRNLLDQLKTKSRPAGNFSPGLSKQRAENIRKSAADELRAILSK